MIRLLCRLFKQTPAPAVVETHDARTNVLAAWDRLTCFRESEGVPADEWDLLVDRCLKATAIPAECVPQLHAFAAWIEEHLPRTIGNTAAYYLICRGVVQFLLQPPASVAGGPSGTD